MTLGLGIDAGGTETRWALARSDGTIVAAGEAPGMSAVMMNTTEGRQRIRDTMAAVAKGVLAVGRPTRMEAGVTGLPESDAALQTLLAEPFDLELAAVTVESDIAFAYLGQFRPGEGYVVYAGTGSVAAYIDENGTLHRAGGRGAILDDGGGGFWIAREALRHIWRREDEAPGSWESSPMARAVFEHAGGSDWAYSRQFIYGQERGEVGKLALAVAASVGQDPAAAAILREAGRELGRLANALLRRFGPRPVALAGRAAELHPSIAASMRASLPPDTILTQSAMRAHHAAARLAVADISPAFSPSNGPT